LNIFKPKAPLSAVSVCISLQINSLLILRY
jgi:hypothetical protein